MYKFLKKSRKGFTLIELIVVIAILAILAAIAIPAFMGISDEANTNVEIADARIIISALNAHNALNPDSPITTTTDWEDNIDSNLKPSGLPDDTTGILERIGTSTDDNGNVTFTLQEPSE